MNSLYKSMGPKNPMDMLNEFRNSNPVDILNHLGYNIPSGMNNPQQIVNHLLGKGQVMPAQMQRIQQVASRLSAGAHAVPK